MIRSHIKIYLDKSALKEVSWIAFHECDKNTVCICVISQTDKRQLWLLEFVLWKGHVPCKRSYSCQWFMSWLLKLTQCWLFGWFQGKLVYANQGKPSDYQELNKTMDLRGTIAITRYGGAGRAAKVSLHGEKPIMMFMFMFGNFKMMSRNILYKRDSNYKHILLW